MRALGPVLLLVFLGHLLLPAGIVMDFLIDQDRIAHELCVQRLVPDEMRTCHGHCYLSQKLKEVDTRERELPGTLRALKLDDAIPVRTGFQSGVVGPTPVVLPPDAGGTTLTGCVPVSEPVPWC